MKPLTIFLTLLLVSQGALARPYYMQDPSRQNNLTDPDRFRRTRKSPSNAESTKEHWGKIKAARKLTFKDGGLPNKAILKVGPTSEGNTPIEAQAKFGDFSESLKSQILSQLKSGESKSALSQKIINIKGSIQGGNAVEVMSAKLKSNNQTNNPQNVIANNPSAVSIPKQNNSPLINNNQPIQQTKTDLPSNIKNNTADNKPLLRENNKTDINKSKRSSTENKPTQFVRLTPKTVSAPNPVLTSGVKRAVMRSDVAIVSKALATSLGGKPSEVQILVPSNIKTVKSESLKSVIPLNNGNNITLTNVKEVSVGTFQAQFEGSLDTLPKNIQSQIKPQIQKNLKQTGNQASLSQVKEVKGVIQVSIDNKIKVLSAKPINKPIQTPTLNAKTTQPKTGQKQNFRQNQNLSTNQNITNTPNQPLVTSKADVTALKNVAQYLGPDDASQTKSIQVQSVRSSENNQPDGAVAVVALTAGRNLQVYKVGENKETGDITYQAEGQFGDLSSDMQSKIKSVLSDYGVQDSLSKNTPVEIEVLQSKENNIKLISVKIKGENDEGVQETVLLWGNELDGKTKAEPENKKTDGGKIDGVNTPIAGLNLQPKNSDRNPSQKADGLLPAIKEVAKEAFGAKEGEFIASFDKSKKLDEMNLTFTKDNKKSTLLQFQRGPGKGSYEFFAEGKALDFPDQVREQIYQKLEDALLKGEAWAKEAIDNNKDITIELEVKKDPETAEMEIIVKAVYAALEKAALAMSEAMNLSPNEFNLIVDGANGILSLHSGKKLFLTEGVLSPLQLKTPDGGLHVLFKRKNLGKNKETILYMTRKTLKANLQALNQTFKDPKTAQKALKSSANHFVVRLHPKMENGGSINSVRNPSALNKKKKKKPGE